MSYAGLGEFTWPETEDWVHKIRYIERRPIAVKGGMDPWGMERQRVLWTAEQAAWSRIQSLQASYIRTERAMRHNIARYNEVVKELELLTGKSIGTGPIGTYAGMALAIIPGFGWASAAFSMISQLIGILSGTKRKIKSLAAELDRLTATLKAQQQTLRRLGKQIVREASIGENVRAEQQAVVAQQIQRMDLAIQQKASAEQAALWLHRARMASVGQSSQNRVLYAQPEGDL